MNETRIHNANHQATELYIERRFDAPRELVFKAWTVPGLFRRWWGPNGFTTPVCNIDLREGGSYHVCMRSPNGESVWCKGFYRDVDVPERIVCSSFFSNDKGDRLQPTDYGLPADWPAETTFHVILRESEGGTVLCLTQVGVDPDRAEAVGAVAGWNQSFDRLAEILPALG